MPELPEVETIRRGMIYKIKGKTIEDVEVLTPKLFIGQKKNILGARIINVKRVAKVLEIILNNDFIILMHMKMTGQIVFQKKGQKICCAVGGHMQKAYGGVLPHKHTHLIYNFSDGSKLYFNDLRKFGWNRVVSHKEVGLILTKERFGPEPRSKDFTIKYLKNIFSKSVRPIKLVLTDQPKISGLGNIYANDALYWAGILPERSAKSLSDKDIAKLKRTIEKVIDSGLKYGGSSENTYVNLDGRRGKYMDFSAVYQKKIDPKGHLIKRKKIGGRSAFYCPICQY